MIKVLIVEDDSNKLQDVSNVIVKCDVSGEQIHSVNNVKDAISILKTNMFDILVLDLCLPPKNNKTARNNSGVLILKELDEEGVNVPTYILGLTSFDELKSEYEDSFTTINLNLYSYDNNNDWMRALTKSIERCSKSKKAKSRLGNKKVVISIHGISTAGEWQNNLEEYLGTLDDIESYKFKYPHFPFLRLLIPPLRKSVVSCFEVQLKDLIQEHPNSELYFFSHSFGTYVLCKTLEEMKANSSPKIAALVLAGSVLKSTYNITDLKKQLDIEIVINDCGMSDKALLASEIFVWGMGMAGRQGFFTFDEHNVINRFHDGGHSFFENDESFYDEFWTPIIHEKKVNAPKLKKGDPRKQSYAKNMVSGIKLYFWFLMFSGIVYFFL